MELAEKRYIERPASFVERVARRAELARRQEAARQDKGLAPRVDLPALTRMFSVALHGGAAAQEGAQGSEGADRDTLLKLFDARIAHQARPQ